MPPVERQTGKVYWRSLEELADTPEFREFLHREFPAGASEMLDSADRRHFLKIMGASMALAGLGLAGCRRWPEEHIAPFAHRPASRIPGVPSHYATCMDLGGSSQGLLVTSFDGRPVKIEGNPLHPTNGNAADLPDGLSDEQRARRLHGSTDAQAQASVLDLYDPDRSRGVRRAESASTWADFESWAAGHFAQLRSAGGGGLAILTEASSSPSLASMKAALMRAFPAASWHVYEPLVNDNELAGADLAFGRPMRAYHDLSRAEVIVSLDSDFLSAHPAALRLTRQFASTRRPDRGDMSMSRLYVFESGLSITGANADERVALRRGDVAMVAGWLAAKVLDDATLAPFAEAPAGSTQAALERLLADLREHAGESVIIAGPDQPAEVHHLVHLMNASLGEGARDPLVRYSAIADDTPYVGSIADLTSKLDRGAVSTLLILGGNPVYDAPADLGFGAALAKAGVAIHLGAYDNETSRGCEWHLNQAHYLESWGDGRAYDGTVCVRQPLIEPLFGGRTPVELLALISGDETRGGYDLVRRSFREMADVTDFEALWRRTLHDGVLSGSAYTASAPAPSTAGLGATAQALWSRWSALDAGRIEVSFARDMKVHDGRFANNGWLQELPDPITRLTWDNAALMSPSTAEEMGVETGDMIAITVDGRTVESAVMVVPGHAARAITLPLGYGRADAGRIAADAGFDFYPLRSAAAMGFAAAQVQPASGRYTLATVQDHHAIDTTGFEGTQERLPTLVREATLDEYRQHPDFAKHRTHVVSRLSLWDEDLPFQSGTGFEGASYAWAMSIDLSSCTGCGACVVACQAENNIPIVGKDQITRGREMHWIRIDRYFKFDAESPDPDRPEAVAIMPVACQMCENAPCEQVCPVNATVHDKDGLNLQVYNRCIGTRYCSNNCPYKVRRFNFLDYWRHEPKRDPGLMPVTPAYYERPQAAADPLVQMQFSPEVTVRVRGVMEKCTYCVQRIAAARITAKNEWVGQDPATRSKRVAPVADGSLTTACAQACPAEAIIFGDLLDPESRVSKLHAADRSYQLLEETNTKPRTRYLAKLRNPASGGAHGDAGSSHEEAPHG